MLSVMSLVQQKGGSMKTYRETNKNQLREIGRFMPRSVKPSSLNFSKKWPGPAVARTASHKGANEPVSPSDKACKRKERRPPCRLVFPCFARPVRTPDSIQMSGCCSEQLPVQAIALQGTHLDEDGGTAERLGTPHPGHPQRSKPSLREPQCGRRSPDGTPTSKGRPRGLRSRSAISSAVGGPVQAASWNQERQCVSVARADRKVSEANARKHSSASLR